MKIWSDTALKDFKFWSGAQQTVEMLGLTDEQFDELEQMMEETAPADGWNETAVNDFFWFESDIIKEWLGITDYPKFFRFDNKLGNDTKVSVEDEIEEEKLKDIFKANGIKFTEVDEHTVAASEYEFDFNAIDDFLWNEEEVQHKLRIPEWMPAHIENYDFSGLEDDEIKLCEEFMEEYPASDYDGFIYDFDDTNFCIPDVGPRLLTDCITLRIY